MASRQRPRSPRSSASISSDPKPFDASTTSTLDEAAVAKGSSAGEPIIHKDRDARIAELAYQRAEQRGFQPGHALDDWLWAEREIDESLASRGGARDVH